MTQDPTHLTLSHDGAQYSPAAARTALASITEALKGIPTDQAGVRLHGISSLQPLLSHEGPIGVIPAAFLGHRSRPVRAILFDKTPDTNWSLAWHQDRTICVRRRIDVEGYGPWTMKGSIQHVAPPIDLLARMITVRVHLDDVPQENSPLLIAPGSHLSGRIPISEYKAVVARCGTYSCLADAGDAWIYATPILHASEAARMTGHRRVLQIDYSADELSGGLEWLGV